MIPAKQETRLHTFLQRAPAAGAARADRPSVWQLVSSDIDAWGRHWELPPDARGKVPFGAALRLIWNQPGLRATILFRVSHALWRGGVPCLPGMLYGLNVCLHGLDIPACVPVGPGFYVPHPVGTTVMARGLGANVTLVSGITIGQRATREFPLLGDDVFVGAGARVLGRIDVGDGARIGANAVVLTDVPPGATAVGVPARINRSPSRSSRSDAPVAARTPGEPLISEG